MEGFGKCTRPRQPWDILFCITFFIVMWREKECKVLILDFFILTDTWDSEMSGAKLAIVPSQTLAIVLSQTMC